MNKQESITYTLQHNDLINGFSDFLLHILEVFLGGGGG